MIISPDNIKEIKGIEDKMHTFKEDFIEFAISKNVLKFGQFTTKSNRISPYFFNTGEFNSGVSLKKLGEFYARTILDKDIQFDMLFGPSYKGIPLVTSIVIALAELGHDYPFAFNRKEAKDHGEGGIIVGAPLSGRVLVVDDVITAGISVGESIDLIKRYDAIPCGVVIAFDRKEKGNGELSAIQEVEQNYNIPINSIADIHDMLGYMEAKMLGSLSVKVLGGARTYENVIGRISEYHKQYGV